MADETDPLVTIGIPTFNRVALLQNTLRSVCAQTYRRLEIVVCDNASSDATQDVMRQLAREDPRIRYVRQTSNVGAAENFRTVLRLATGDFFMWLGDDDWIDPAYIEACMRVHLRAEGHSFVGGNATFYQNGAVHHRVRHYTLEQRSALGRVLAHWMQLEGWPFYGVMPTRLIAACNVMDTFGGDQIMLAALAWAGKIRTEENVCVHRDLRVGGSWETLKKLYPGWRIRFPNVAVLTYACADIVTKNAIYKRMNLATRVLFAAVVGTWLGGWALMRSGRYYLLLPVRRLIGERRFEAVKAAIRGKRRGPRMAV